MLWLVSLARPIWSSLCFLSSTLNRILVALRLRVTHGKVGHLEATPEINTVVRSPQRPYPENITYICISPEEATDLSTCSSQDKTQKLRHGEVIYILKGKLLAWGGTAVVEQLPSGAVVKTPIPNPYCPPEEEDHRRNMRLEARIYAMIGKHSRVPKIISWDQETCCLEMEFLENGDLKEYILANQHSITLQLRLRWSRQAAEALAVLHALQVIHCDLSPRNFLLDCDLNLKIADFGGASLCGKDPSATSATRFRRPSYDWNDPPVVGDDIFSLGSLIYFIMTGSYPYGDIPSDEVEKLYRTQQFPDVSSVTCGTVIMQCWSQQVDSALAVHDTIADIAGVHSI